MWNCLFNHYLCRPNSLRSFGYHVSVLPSQSPVPPLVAGTLKHLFITAHVYVCHTVQLEQRYFLVYATELFARPMHLGVIAHSVHLLFTTNRNIP